MSQTSAARPEQILQRLDWHVVRRLDGLLQGDYRSLFRGHGVDLADLREYQPPDDTRYIDWNVTARMNTPYVREYTEDRELTAWFLLDLSPSMDWGTLHAQKRAVLTDVVTTLARLLTRQGNRIGAMFYGADADRTIPAHGGRIQVLRITHELLRQAPAPRAPFTDLDPLLQRALRTIKGRSLVLIVSDWIAAPGWERALKLLNARHEVVAVRVWDQNERELPDIGPLIMQDSETGEQLYVDTRDRSFRRRFAEAAQQRETALAQSFKRAGVDILSIGTGEDLVRALVRFAAHRKVQRLR